MAELKDYYAVFDATPGTSLRKIEKKYRKNALKYQPYTRVRESFRNKFINAILAWDMIQKVEARLNTLGKSREELFYEWQENEMSAAMDRAIYYCTLTEEEFEKVILKGFSRLIYFVYGFFFLLFSLGIIIPLIFRNYAIALVFFVPFILPILWMLSKTIRKEKGKQDKANLMKRLRKFRGKKLKGINADQEFKGVFQVNSKQITALADEND